MQLEEPRIGGTVVNVEKIAPRKNTAGKEISVREKSEMLPFISLLYILNGNHDPSKVQRLNIGLAILFVVGGILSGLDLLPVGFLFLAVAVVNGANLWYIRKHSYHFFHPIPKDILTLIESTSRKAIHHRMPS